jgi:hypothetical protein
LRAGPATPWPDLAHRRPLIGVTGSDLDISQVNARVEHDGDRRVAEHLRVRPGDRYSSSGDVPQAAVAAWQSMRAPRLVRRIGPPVRDAIARSMARPIAGGSGTRTTLVPLPQTRSTR